MIENHLMEWLIDIDRDVANFRTKLLIISLQSDKRDYLDMLYKEMAKQKNWNES